MKLTVLGKYGPFPAKNGSCNSYLLQDGETNILIDCGSGALRNLHIGFDEISAVVLSHLHFDHISDIFVLTYALQIENMRKKISKLKVYMPSSPAQTSDLLKASPYFEIIEINEDTQIKIGGINVSFAEMTHPVPCFASKFEKDGKALVYLADTTANDKIIPFVKDADMLLVDCSILKKDQAETSPHMSIFEAGEIANTANVKKLIGTHLFPGYCEQDILDELKQNYKNAVLAVENKSYLI